MSALSTRWLKIPTALMCALSVLAWSLSAVADDFAPASLIIPMDTAYQDTGMLRAYGLIYELLRNGVPVRWVIKKGKSFQGVDFTASATDHQTNAVVAAHGYRGGPFVIDSADAAAAIPIINAWQAKYPETKVHHATTMFTGDVARYLVVAPRVAMHADGNQTIARSYLMAAGIPDSTLNTTWPNNSPDMLTPAQVAGPTTSNHHDGALFDADGDPVYCQFMSMHWNVSSAVASPETVAEVRAFLGYPVHFFAECQAVDAFENLVPYGFFLTPNGYVIKGQPNAIDNYNFDSTFAQYDGAFGTVGGSEPAFALPAGDQYKAGGITMITAKNSPPGTNDLWMTGFLDGACPPNVEVCGSLGKVSYLGGHQYSTNVPISTNPKTQGVRLFLNSLFDSTCASASGQPAIFLIKSAPATTTTPTVTFTITYSNGGQTVALNAVLTDAVPPGATFVAATNGGVFAGGKVTWDLGNLGSYEFGAVSFTVNLGSFGSYNNTASVAYKVGLNQFSKPSNTTTTLYDKDSDGDGVLDAVDTCPNNYNPAQDLSSDILSCGACGVVCVAANGTPACASGTCVVAGCNLGFSDCDGLYPDGCEYSDSGFGGDPQNCGGCGAVCSPAHATGSCVGGACGIGSCAPGYSDCNKNPADGCEYDDANFASDPQNCGACGGKCAAGFICSGGVCTVNNCPPGFSDCNKNPADGCEYNTSGFANDPQNCGGCGLVCSPAHATGSCAGGMCVIGMCSPGYSDCNGLPADGCEYNNAGFDKDTGNCGGCGVACSPAHAVGSCVGGMCGVASCAPGYSNCNGDPADGCEYSNAGFTSDPQNCGGCGMICAPQNAAGACVAGACGIGSCLPGHVDLNNNPADGCEYACSVVSASDTTCDGKDDDCDGIFDEDYAPSTCGVGACQSASSCVQGSVICVPGLPSAEGPLGDPTCSDGIDNDCDGAVDGVDMSCQMGSCAVDADCDDANPCTDDHCVNGMCTHAGNGCGGGSASSSAASSASSSASSASSSGAGGASSSGAGGASSSASSAASSGTGGASSSAASGASSSGAGGAANSGSTSSSGEMSSGAGAGGGSSSGSGGSANPGDTGACACRAGGGASDDLPRAALFGAMLLVGLARRRRSRMRGAGDERLRTR